MIRTGNTACFGFCNARSISNTAPSKWRLPGEQCGT